MEIACNNQSEQFELLSNHSLEDCLNQAFNENNNSSCFGNTANTPSCDDVCHCYGMAQ